MTSTLSIMSLESQRLRYGRYSLWYSDNLLYLSDGEKTATINLADTSLIEWTPDTMGSYPAIPGGYKPNTLMGLLIEITEALNKGLNIDNAQEWFDAHKEQFTGYSAFEFWQSLNYPDIMPDNMEKRYKQRWTEYINSLSSTEFDYELYDIWYAKKGYEPNVSQEKIITYI